MTTPKKKTHLRRQNKTLYGDTTAKKWKDAVENDRELGARKIAMDRFLNPNGLHHSTINRYLNKIGLRTIRKKPCIDLTADHKRLRLKWAKLMLKCP